MPEIQLPADFFTFALQKSPELCPVAGCRKKRGVVNRLCNRHRMEKWRAANPTKAAYQTLKDHARARRIPFELTLEQFTRLAEQTNYLAEKGHTKGCVQLDRIDASGGYTLSNMQVLSVSDNTAKGNRERWGREYQETLLRRKGYVVDEGDSDEGLIYEPNDSDPF